MSSSVNQPGPATCPTCSKIFKGLRCILWHVVDDNDSSKSTILLRVSKEFDFVFRTPKVVGTRALGRSLQVEMRGVEVNIRSFLMTPPPNYHGRLIRLNDQG